MVNGVLMPKAGITVESCIIGKWRKAVGDRVAVGDILFDYETDKASFECESTAGGELLEIFFQDGDEVPCLVNVCAIGTKGEDCASLRPVGTTPAAPSAPAEEAPGVRAELTPSAPAGTGAPVSPRARKLAETAGVDAAQAAGTGPNGRIIERDVRRLMSEGAPVREALPVEEEAFAARDSGLSGGEAEYEDVKFSNIRRVIARGMVNSLQAMAQLTEHFSFDASAIQGYRKLLKGMEGDCAGITLGDMLLFAVSRTILDYPDLNANAIEDGSVRRFRHVNLGVAVDTPRGLMVPTIFHADQKSLLQISREVRELAAQARSGRISPDLLAGGTFTVTNLGSTGVEMFTPIINPPQTGILGVCGITQRVRAGEDGQAVLYPAMGLSLTVDHRIVDGAPAAYFMRALCGNLERFTALLAL
ncbi:MAG: 2-oxo acid dehydrogenase subunit E2 [Oscillospiraceae bacterium]|jgi:pyruvate dehydrogenase E2 component (dihydrolipoamide acetyltransferase)|nr:2-oxo acid dehydrogenase subunit E2 [Oscillospiraceae bacterium]